MMNAEPNPLGDRLSSPLIGASRPSTVASADRTRQTEKMRWKPGRRRLLARLIALTAFAAFGLSACGGATAPPPEFLNRPILYDLEVSGGIIMAGESVEAVWPVTATQFVEFLRSRLEHKVTWELVDQNRWILRTTSIDRMTKHANSTSFMLQSATQTVSCGGKVCEGPVVLVSDIVFNGQRLSKQESWNFVGEIRKAVFASK